MKNDTLDTRRMEAEARYQDLAAKVHRKTNGIPCESIIDHELVDKMVTLVTWNWADSYQLYQCLVCDKWVIKDYAGSNAKEIPKSVVKALLKHAVLPSKYQFPPPACQFEPKKSRVVRGTIVERKKGQF